MKLRAIIVLIVIAAVLGVVFYAVSRPTPVEPTQPRPYVWDFEMDNLQRIEITLEQPAATVAWVKHEDRYFYFDEPNGIKVDMNRWGGGVPLILSGPGAERRIFQDATTEKLDELGFDTPQVKIKLTLNDDTVFNVEVGDSTPSGQAYYVRLAELRDIFTVDYTWYDVVSGLVTNPPIPLPTFTNEALTINPAEPLAGQAFTISAQMVNSGGLTGKSDVKLMINGVVEQTKTIELGRDERTTVVFNVTRDKPGTYSVNVEGKTAKLVVK